MREGLVRPVQLAALGFVALCWWLLGAALLFRKRPPPVREARREPGWKSGLLLQAGGVGLIVILRRPVGSPWLGLGPLLETVAALVAVVLAAGSAWIIWRAERVLGRQFAYQARLIEGHRLITEGPYRWVRHPMYAVVFILAVATAITWSRWTALPPFVVLYAVGTAVRVRCEDKLLQAAFGAEFEAYRRRVPALIPRLSRQRGRISSHLGRRY